MGFAEILLIAIVALLILGPKQLPKVAHFIGRVFGSANSIVTSVQKDIKQGFGVTRSENKNNSKKDKP